MNVFVAAKKSGGDSLRGHTGLHRADTGQDGDAEEIDTILAARKYEFKVMSVIPFGIVAYMKLSFPRIYGCVVR